MKKPVFAMLLGGFLGIFDGLSALVSAPETRPAIAGIVIGSTFKGLLTGVLIGLFAKKVQSTGWTVAFGIACSVFLAYLVARMNGKYYLEIMLPGALLGLIVGLAAQSSWARGTKSPAV